jgi:hypothetical protein
MTFFFHSFIKHSTAISEWCIIDLGFIRAAWPLSWASSSVEALAGIPFLVQLCAHRFFLKNRTLPDRSISAPSLGYQAC